MTSAVLAGAETPPGLSASDPNRERRQRRAAYLGLLGCGLVLYAPWLRPGYLLGFDWVSGPRTRLPPAIYGLPQGRASEAPLVALVTGLRSITFGVDPMAILLVVSPVLFGVGFERLLGRRPLLWAVAAVVASVNPFVDERLGAGSYWFVLAMVVLPFVAVAAKDVAGGSVRGGLRWALLNALGAAIAPQMLELAGIVSVAVVIAQYHRHGDVSLARVARASIVGIGTLVVLSAYWLVPTMVGGYPAYSEITTKYLAIFATRALPHIGIYGTLLALYGFWRPDTPLTTNLIAGWPLLGAAFLAVVGFGLTSWYRQGERAMVGALVGSAIVGFLVAVGDHGVTAALFLALFTHLPGFKALVEPEQALALVVLLYAVGYGVGAGVLVDRCSSPITRIAQIGIVVALPLAYSASQLWGLNATATPVSYPTSWAEAQAITASAPGTILALPWNKFEPEVFTANHTIEDPAADYFSDPVLLSDNDELPGVGDDSTDPREQWVLHVLDEAPRISDVGRLLVPLGVRWVFWEHAPARTYEWLYHQRDLHLVRAWPHAALFVNQAWQGEAYVQEPDAKTRPIPLASTSPTALVLAHRPPPGSQVVVCLPYAAGWRLGSSPPRRTNAGTMAFAVPEHPSFHVVYEPWQVVRVSDMVALATAIGSLGWLTLGRRRSQDRAAP